MDVVHAALVERTPGFELDELEVCEFWDEDSVWGVVAFMCPRCSGVSIYLGTAINSEHYRSGGKLTRRYLLHPSPTGPRELAPVPSEVPRDIAEDFEEAAAVLKISPKASAALSRRCLQSLLSQAAGAKCDNLADQIEEALVGGDLPSYLAEAIDAIRNIGNYATHPIKSKSTGQIVAVEAGEAEWNLEVLGQLFDFYYVQPRLRNERIDKLNKKLADIGKPPIKGSES